MNKKGWTLAELTVIVIIILILTKASMSVVKNININKARIYTYITMKNLTMGNIAIREKYTDFYPKTALEHDSVEATDWYCLNLADIFAKDGSTNCNKNLPAQTDNFILANGVSIKGVSSNWIQAYDNLYYKDLLIDIDNTNGINKLGIDRFPLRVFKGSNANGDSTDGIVLPVDCQNGKDILYNKDGDLITLYHSYCTGTSNIASSNELISYGAFKVTDGNKPKTASIIFAGKSAIEIDCLTSGGKGFYNYQICANKGYYLHEKCAHESTCADCEENGTCPNGGTESNCNILAENNKVTLQDGSKKGYKCFSMISKPMDGMGLIGGAVMGEIGI